MAEIPKSFKIFKQFGSTNVPHIIEKIFEALDLESLVACRNVDKTWRELLTSGKGQSILREKIREAEIRLIKKSKEGDLDEVLRILSCPMVDVNCEHLVYEGGDKSTPLLEATLANRKSVRQALIKRGADHSKSSVNCSLS